MPGRHRDGYEVVLTDHVFDKVRSIDMTLAEFEILLDEDEVIEETSIDECVRSWSHHGVAAATPCRRCRG